MHHVHQFLQHLQCGMITSPQPMVIRSNNTSATICCQGCYLGSKANELGFRAAKDLLQRLAVVRLPVHQHTRTD